MSTSANVQIAPVNPLPTSLLRVKENNLPRVLKMETISDESIWQNFLASNRILHFFRPDYFMIYKFSNSTILFEQNINLDLGIQNVTADKIIQYLSPTDLDHIRSTDKIICSMAVDHKLQPLDFICRIYGNMECPNPQMKRILRTSFLIHSNAAGVPELGFFCFHDVTSMISSIKPNNYEITFDAGQPQLIDELSRRMKALQPGQPTLSCRNCKNLSCINKGKNSNEIHL
jgi:hypothetical protein